MTRFLCLGAVGLSALVFVGCGLTLELSERDAGGVADAANGRDAGMVWVDGDVPDAGDCPDEDMDGYFACIDDCDDSDPDRNPAADVICGDGIAQDCSSATGDDTLCMGRGTYVSESMGDDGATGTRDDPLASIAAGLRNAVEIAPGTVFDVYIAAGYYPENIDLVEGASLIGGHDPASWTRDPETFPTRLTSDRPEGTVAPTGITRRTDVDGMVLQSTANTRAASLTIQDGAAPRIVDSKITAPDTTSASRGIEIRPGTGRPLIMGSFVELGASASGDYGDGAGSTGIFVTERDVQILQTDVVLASGGAFTQIGIRLERTPPEASLVRVRVENSGGPLLRTFGIVVQAGGATIDRAFVDAGEHEQGAGIALFSPGPRVDVMNSIALGSGAEFGDVTAGLWIEFEGGVPNPTPEIVVSSNFFMGARGAFSGGSAGIVLSASDEFSPADPNRVGRFRNNILFSGLGGRTAGFLEITTTRVEPEVVSHNAFYNLDGNPELYLADGGAILDPTDGTAAAFFDTNIASSCGVLWNMLPPVRLAASSSCIDKGTRMDMPPIDWDRDTRPNGPAPDIGPDEYY